MTITHSRSIIAAAFLLRLVCASAVLAISSSIVGASFCAALRDKL